MNYTVAAQSIIGQVRKNNEDNLCINDWFLDLSHGDSSLIHKSLPGFNTHLLGVFDGMGGYLDGERASYIAAKTASGYMDSISKSTDPRSVLTTLCLDANKKVCAEADGSQMGTTCALLCLSSGTYTLCNIGDSPVFLFRQNTLQQISMDHNSRATYEKATGQPARPGQKFKLTQCIGIPEDEMLIEPFLDSGTVQPGDFFLLCSDGITDMLSTEVICQILQTHSSPREAATALIGQAYSAGGKDNATVICVKVEGKNDFLHKITRLFNKP